MDYLVPSLLAVAVAARAASSHEETLRLLSQLRQTHLLVDFNRVVLSLKGFVLPWRKTSKSARLT